MVRKLLKRNNNKIVKKKRIINYNLNKPKHQLNNKMKIKIKIHQEVHNMVDIWHQNKKKLKIRLMNT